MIAGNAVSGANFFEEAITFSADVLLTGGSAVDKYTIIPDRAGRRAVRAQAQARGAGAIRHWSLAVRRYS
jgi:hypothetical protein